MVCSLANKIPTWDKMKKCSLAGLGWCSQCKNGDENITHMFITCPFTTQIWNFSQYLLNTNLDWQGKTLEES